MFGALVAPYIPPSDVNGVLNRVLGLRDHFILDNVWMLSLKLHVLAWIMVEF